MKNLFISLLIGAALLGTLSKAHGLDINLFNIDVNGPEGRQASELYGNSYGFPPEQVTPALLGPTEEVPAIMRIAQAAGTVPMSVWMMRRMGMDYSRILQNFALAPATLLGASTVPQQPALAYAPTWSRVMNPFYVQSSRAYFLRDILKVDPISVSKIYWQRDYYPERGYWLPPGQAKKLGLWVPPGQAKKMWGWGPGKGKWKIDDDDGFGIDDDDNFKEKHGFKVKKVKYHANEKHGHGKHGGNGHGKGK